MNKKSQVFRWSEYFIYKDWPVSVCKVCLQVRDGFEWHHVVARMYGGTDSYLNVLCICKTCHSIISFGDDPDAYVRQMACVEIQQARFGLHWLVFQLKTRKAYYARFEKLPPELTDVEHRLINLVEAVRSIGRWNFHRLLCNQGAYNLHVCQSVLHDGATVIKRYYDSCAFTKNANEADKDHYLSGRIHENGMSKEALELLRNGRNNRVESFI